MANWSGLRIVHMHSGVWNTTWCGRRVDCSDLAGNRGRLPSRKLGRSRYCSICKTAKRSGYLPVPTQYGPEART